MRKLLRSANSQVLPATTTLPGSPSLGFASPTIPLSAASETLNLIPLLLSALRFHVEPEFGICPYLANREALSPDESPGER